MLPCFTAYTMMPIGAEHFNELRGSETRSRPDESGRARVSLPIARRAGYTRLPPKDWLNAFPDVIRS